MICYLYSVARIVKMRNSIDMQLKFYQYFSASLYTWSVCVKLASLQLFPSTSHVLLFKSRVLKCLHQFALMLDRGFLIGLLRNWPQPYQTRWIPLLVLRVECEWTELYCGQFTVSLTSKRLTQWWKRTRNKNCSCVLCIARQRRRKSF